MFITIDRICGCCRFARILSLCGRIYNKNACHANWLLFPVSRPSRITLGGSLTSQPGAYYLDCTYLYYTLLPSMSTTMSGIMLCSFEASNFWYALTTNWYTAALAASQDFFTLDIHIETSSKSHYSLCFI